MSESDDQLYFQQRARRERAISNDCPDPGAALAHRRLAEAYERQAAGLSGPRATVQPVGQRPA